MCFVSTGLYISLVRLEAASIIVNHVTSIWCYSTAQVGWAPSQYPKRRLFVRSRKVSKPRDLYLELSDRSEILQALGQQCCRCACYISKRYDNLKYQSRGFEILRDLTKRRLFGYWDGALVVQGMSRASIHQEDIQGSFWVGTQPMRHGVTFERRLPFAGRKSTINLRHRLIGIGIPMINLRRSSLIAVLVESMLIWGFGKWV